MSPPLGLDEIIAVFGDCHDANYETTHIETFDLPYPLVYSTAMVRRSRCHRLLIPTFQAVFQAIHDEGLIEKATHYGGIYANRPIRDRRFPSTHSWGIAVDINPQENPLGGKGTMDSRIIDIFKDHGFSWGGEFKSRRDPMHFQFATHY